MLGEAVWFKTHKLAMSLTLLLGLAGLVPIIIDRGLTPITSLEYHPIVGLIAIIIAICQPVIAYFRPGKVGGQEWTSEECPRTILGGRCSMASTPR